MAQARRPRARHHPTRRREVHQRPRFVDDLPEDRFVGHRVGQIPSTPNGLLRALSRRLGLRPRLHGSDLFGASQASLQSHRDERGIHPVFVWDDAEGMRVQTFDLVHRLAAAELDGEHHVSILLSGTDQLVRTLQDPRLEPLCGRFAYSHALLGFGLEDARNYVRFQVESASDPHELFYDKAVTAIFHASGGLPRRIHPLALQALVQSVVLGLDAVDEDLMKRVVHAHLLYRHGPLRGHRGTRPDGWSHGHHRGIGVGSNWAPTLG